MMCHVVLTQYIMRMYEGRSAMFLHEQEQVIIVETESRIVFHRDKIGAFSRPVLDFVILLGRSLLSLLIKL